MHAQGSLGSGNWPGAQVFGQAAHVESASLVHGDANSHTLHVEQLSHLAIPALAWCVPSIHGVHDSAPPAEYVPRAQLSHVDTRAFGMHAIILGIGAIVPSAQSVQT